MRQTKRWYADRSSLAQQAMACRIRSLLTWIKYDRIKHGWVARLRRNSATGFRCSNWAPLSPYARPGSRPVAPPALDCMDSRWRLSGPIHRQILTLDQTHLQAAKGLQ